MNRKAKIFAYYFPGFSRNRAIDEWDIVTRASPRFEGHQQPRSPSKKYYIEDESEVIDAIRMAKDNGLDGLTFLLYWDNGRIQHEDALRLFCKHFGDDQDFGFNILWVNRRLHTKYPIESSSTTTYKPSEDRRVGTSITDLSNLLEYLAKNYTNRSNYLRVDGRPTFQVYDTQDFIHWTTHGEECNRRTVKELFESWTAIATLPDMKYRPWMEDLRHYFQFATGYVLLPNFTGMPIQSYRDGCQNAEFFWGRATELTGLSFLPTVTVGWDATPRGRHQLLSDFDGPTIYPDWPVIVGCSPQHFQSHLEAAVRRATADALPLVNISSFNEWSEGHALEPDEVHGSGYLEAVRACARNTF